MCDKTVSDDFFMLKYFLDRYKTQKISDKAVDNFLPALKFLPEWFLTSKMIKKLDDALFANDYIIFINEDFNNVTFFGGEMSILRVDLYKINLDDVNFDEDDPQTIICIRLMVRVIDTNNANHVKKI